MNTIGFIKGDKENEATDPSIDAYNALHPKLFGALVSLTLKRREGELGKIDLSLRLTKYFDADEEGPPPTECLLLEFNGVQQLRFGAFEMLVGLVLSVRPIRDKQWDDLNYKVYDLEQEERVAFYCKDFTAKLVDL